MSAVLNQTPFVAKLWPHTTHDGLKCQVLVVKGIWSLRTGRLADTPGVLALRDIPLTVRLRQLRLAPIQAEVLAQRLDEEIDWLPDDTSPPKPLFDFMVCGYAWSPTGRAEERFSASIDYRDTRIGLALHAPRRWQGHLLRGGGATPGPALAPVLHVPLHPTFAYGGMPSTSHDPDNPEGMGAPPTNSGGLADSLLPWIEHPESALTTVLSTPTPATYGPWSAGARHRSRHAGTYDGQWKRTRAPLQPADFDARYFNQAEPRLQWPQAPAAGEVIDLNGLSPRGAQRIVWPAIRLGVNASATAGFKAASPPALQSATTALRPDTCIVCPDEDLYAIVWRTLVAAHGTPRLQVM